MSNGLRISGLSVDRGGTTVVNSVSLDVTAGSITALLGPNGAGKSSLVLACGGVIPAQGSVMVVGDDVAGLSPERVRSAGLAIVPEGHRLLTSMTAADNLDVAASNHSRSVMAERRGRVLDIIPELVPLLDRQAGALSGGEQQMVAVGQALMSDPKVLVVDELSLGLAPLIVDRLLRMLEELAGAGIGVLLIEQFVSKALKIADQAYVLANGTISYQGRADELRQDPDRLASAYLGTASGVEV